MRVFNSILPDPKVKLPYESHVGQLKECRRLLDFGCGWGRIIRFFLKDVEPSALYGVDPVEDMVSLCRTDNRWCAFEVSPRRPPSRFPDGHFDLIYAYSVFSHLSEEVDPHTHRLPRALPPTRPRHAGRAGAAPPLPLPVSPALARPAGRAADGG